MSLSSQVSSTMAAVRLVCFPAAAARSSHTRQFHTSPPPRRNPCILSLTTKLRRPNLHLCLVQSQAQTQPIVQSEENVVVLEDADEEDEASKTRLLAQNVPWTCTVDDIRPLFEKYGTIVDIEFSMYNKNRNRGLAFVSMASHEEAVAAINSLDSTEFEGRVLKLDWAKPRKAKPPTAPKPMPVHNLYVANLSFQARAQDLKDFFSANNANVVSAEVVYNNETPRRPAGYGFVSFSTKAEAEAALVGFQGKEFMGRPVRVAPSKKFLRQGTKAAIDSEAEGLKRIEYPAEKDEALGQQ